MTQLLTMTTTHKFSVQVIPKCTYKEGVIRVKLLDMLQTTLTRLISYPDSQVMRSLKAEGWQEVSIAVKWGADGHSQGWKFISCSHCQELGQHADLASDWLHLRVNNQSEARSES